MCPRPWDAIMTGTFMWSPDPTVFTTSSLFVRNADHKNDTNLDYQTAYSAWTTVDAVDRLSKDLYDRTLQFHATDESKPVGYSFQYNNKPNLTCQHLFNSR